MDLGTATTAKDTIGISKVFVTGLTTTTKLVGTGGVTANAADGTVAKVTADGATVTDADLVILSQTYANDAAALAGIKTAGSDTFVTNAALDDNDSIMIAYTDGTNSYIAVGTTSAATTDSDDFDSLVTVLELSGISSLAALDSTDYSVVT